MSQVSASGRVRLLLIVAAISSSLSSRNLVGALFSAQAQHSQGCDSARLIRCQQDVLRDMQALSFQSANVQYPLSGPPYSPKQQLQQLQQQLVTNSTACRLIRSNLDCLLNTTPACYDYGNQAAQNTDLILRAKRTLEQSHCNDPETWQSTFCFRSPDIKNCEERYGFNSFGPSATLANNATACYAYLAFKNCVDSHIRLSCRVNEKDMMNEYLIDRASDLAWRCPANLTGSANLMNYNPYALSNPSGQILSPSGYGGYEQRPIPTYVGSSGGNLNLFNPARDQPWERFRNPLDDATRIGVSRFPGSGDVFERLVAGNNFDLESSDCPNKAAPYARECEEALVEQQRLARDSRNGQELERRICWDCISRVVLDRCADSTPTAVEILMGPRRRELSSTCRIFNRDICSGSLREAIFSFPIMSALLLVALFNTLRWSIE